MEHTNNEFNMIEVPTGTVFTRYYEDGNPSSKALPDISDPRPVYTTDKATSDLINNSDLAQGVLALRGTSKSVPNTAIDIVTTKPITIMQGNIAGSTNPNATQNVVRTKDLDGLSIIEESERLITKK